MIIITDKRMLLIFLIGLIVCKCNTVSAQEARYAVDTIARDFNKASAVTVDPKGIIFVADEGTNEIIKLAPDGKILLRVGGYGWTTTALDQPRDIISPNGIDVYVADYGNHRIIRFDRNLNIVSLIPPEDKNSAVNRLFGYPLSIALSSLGRLFILDGENKRLLQIASPNRIERSIGGIDAGKGRLKNPQKTRLNSKNNIFVQDGNKIIAFDVFGNYLRSFGKEVFKALRTFAVNDNNLFVIDSCYLYEMNVTGDIISEISLSVWIKEDSGIIGVFAKEKMVYLLTEHDLYLIRKKDYDD
jgi:DNA-binding beta-propeller fold protein YncE